MRNVKFKFLELLFSDCTVQVSSNLYLGGCHGIESPSEKEQAAFGARTAGARYETFSSYCVHNGVVTHAYYSEMFAHLV